MKKIGVIVGCKVSDEIAGWVRANLEVPEGTEVLVVGAQDGMSDDELRALSEGVEPGPYVDALSDGTTVHLRKEDVVKNMRNKAEELREQGVVASMICCTMDYSQLEDIEDLLIPSKFVENAALALVPKGGTIGVINPIEETMDYEIQKWKRLPDYKIVNLAAPAIVQGSPEAALLSEEEFATAEQRPVEAAKKLVEQGAELIVLDCMGFTKEHREKVSKATGKPVIQPQSLLGKTVETLYCL